MGFAGRRRDVILKWPVTENFGQNKQKIFLKCANFRHKCFLPCNEQYRILYSSNYGAGLGCVCVEGGGRMRYVPTNNENNAKRVDDLITPIKLFCWTQLLGVGPKVQNTGLGWTFGSSFLFCLHNRKKLCCLLSSCPWFCMSYGRAVFILAV